MSEATEGKPRRLYRTRRWYRWTLRGLAAGAAGVSTVLLAESTREGAGLPGCGGDGGGLFGDCATVLASGWSTWLGLPVAVFGVAVYAMLFLAALYIGPGRPPRLQRRAWRVVTLLSVTAGLSGLWFVLVQAWLIEGWCLYCTAVHMMGVALMGLVLASGHVRRTRSGRYAAAAALPVLALVLGQVFGPDGMGKQASNEALILSGRDGHDDPAHGEGGAVRAEVVGDAGPGPGRAITLSVGGTGVRLSPGAVSGMPVLGGVEAEHLALYVYDYACGYCREMSPTLDAVLKRYNAGPTPTLGIVLLPAVRDGACNEAFDRSTASGRRTCDAATRVLALAMTGRADEAAKWHRILMNESLRDGLERFDQAHDLPPGALDQAADQLRRNGRLREMLGGTTPQLIVGRAHVRGRVAELDQMLEILTSQIGEPPPPETGSATP